MKQPLTIGFIGLGLIGGSIAKAIRYYYPDTRIIAHTRSQATIDYALNEQIIDIACDQVDARFSECDYIFLCAPVEANASYLEILKPLIQPGCILTDVGSTKTDIHTHVADLGLEGQFIGGHPMGRFRKNRYCQCQTASSGKCLLYCYSNFKGSKGISRSLCRTGT